MRTMLTAAVLLLAGGTLANAADLCGTEADCADAATTADIVACYAKATKRADDAMNGLWPKVMALYDGNRDAKGDKSTLQQAQDDWIAFRNSTCDAESRLADGGTIAGIYLEECRCAVTAARVADFDRMIADRSEGN